MYTTPPFQLRCPSIPRHHAHPVIVATVRACPYLCIPDTLPPLHSPIVLPVPSPCCRRINRMSRLKPAELYNRSFALRSFGPRGQRNAASLLYLCPHCKYIPASRGPRTGTPSNSIATVGKSSSAGNVRWFRWNLRYFACNPAAPPEGRSSREYLFATATRPPAHRRRLLLCRRDADATRWAAPR